MFYVYVLYSEKLNRFYLGSTKDLKRRVLQHKVRREPVDEARI